MRSSLHEILGLVGFLSHSDFGFSICTMKFLYDVRQEVQLCSFICTHWAVAVYLFADKIIKLSQQLVKRFGHKCMNVRVFSLLLWLICPSLCHHSAASITVALQSFWSWLNMWILQLWTPFLDFWVSLWSSGLTYLLWNINNTTKPYDILIVTIFNL